MLAFVTPGVLEEAFFNNTNLRLWKSMPPESINVLCRNDASAMGWGKAERGDAGAGVPRSGGRED